MAWKKAMKEEEKEELALLKKKKKKNYLLSATDVTIWWIFRKVSAFGNLYRCFVVYVLQFLFLDMENLEVNSKHLFKAFSQSFRSSCLRIFSFSLYYLLSP